MLTPVRCRLRTRASFCQNVKETERREASAGADSVPMVMPETVALAVERTGEGMDRRPVAVQGISASSATY